VRARDVQVGEVRAVGFVQVVVAVVGGVEGGGEHWHEEVARGAVFAGEVDLGDEAFEDAPLVGEEVLAGVVRERVVGVDGLVWGVWRTYVPDEREVLEIEERESDGD
jgi:hypothetical protein